MGFFSHTNPLTPYDVVGCHRLKKMPGEESAPTIIRFTNRKVVEFCMNNRHRLKSVNAGFKMNLRFREDLCPANDNIFKECEKLLDQNLISKVFTHNGFVKVVKSGPNSRINYPVRIHHKTDLENMFPGYFEQF